MADKMQVNPDPLGVTTCERCGLHPDSWFFDGGYICASCMDEWRVVGHMICDWWRVSDVWKLYGKVG